MTSTREGEAQTPEESSGTTREQEPPHRERDDPNTLDEDQVLQKRQALMRSILQMQDELGIPRARQVAGQGPAELLSATPLAKRPDVRIRPPPDSEKYSTRDYAHYRSFITNQKATSDANGWDEAQRVAVTKVYLNHILYTLWEDKVLRDNSQETWKDLCEFLESQLGDSANRRMEAWERLLLAKPRDEEADNTYLQRWMEMKAEVGEDTREIDTVWLHIFYMSFPTIVRRKICEQPTFPSSVQDFIALLAKLRPNIAFQQAQNSRIKQRLQGQTGQLPGSASIPPSQNWRKRPRESPSPTRDPSKQKELTPASSARDKKSSQTDLSRITCFNCGQKGHYKNNCPEPAKIEGVEVKRE